jgi:hypothetical protein
MNSTTHCDINNNNKDNRNSSKGNKPIIQMNSTKTKLTYHPQ